MHNIIRFIALIFLLLSPKAFAQQTILQAGTWTDGHAPMYVGNGSYQPVVQDSGPAAGGNPGLGLSELNIASRGTGIGPFPDSGTGPNGSHFCMNDGPATSANGYHYLCFDPNAAGGGLLSYGAAGSAGQLPFNFIVNGQTYTFPFVTGGIIGPNTTTVGDLAVWANTAGTLMGDISHISLAQLPLISSGTVLCNNSGASAVPTACGTLPAPVQANITGVGTLTSGTWGATPITGAFIANATVTGSNIATNTVANSNLVQAPATTVKCNAGVSTANVADCTSSQLQNVIQQTECANIQSALYGGKGDNSTDNASAINAALAALPSGGGCIYFPPGKYRINSQIAFSMPSRMFAVTLKGDGAGATILRFPNSSGGFAFTWNSQENSIHVRDMAVTTDQSGTTNGLQLINTQTYTGFQEGTQSEVMNVTFQGDTGTNAAFYWGTAASVQNLDNVNFINDLFYGGGGVGNGISLSTTGSFIAGGYNLTSDGFFDLNIGLLTTNNPQGPSVVSCSFVDNVIGISTEIGSSALEGMTVSASNFASTLRNFLAQTQINDLVMTGNTFFDQDTAHSADNILLASVARFTFTGNVVHSATSTTGAALTVENTNGWPGIITGNAFTGSFATGVILTSASSLVNVQSNVYGSGIATKVVNNGTSNTVGGGSM